MMNHDEIRHAIASYALDAMDERERAVVESRLLEHLPGCDDCAAMLGDFRDVAGDLALAVDPVAPSPMVERRIMNAIRSDASAPARRGRWTRLGLVASVVMLAASALWNVSMLSRNDAANDRERTLVAALELAAHRDARTVALHGKDGAGSMRVAHLPTGEAVLIGTGIPGPPADHVFELWLLDGSPIPIRTFVPDDGVVVVRFQVGARTVRGAAITVEKSFVKAPTTEPVYAGTAT